MAMGLIKGEGFAVDASVMEANASRYHGKALDELDWTDKQRQTRAVGEYSCCARQDGQTQSGSQGAEGRLAVRSLIGPDGQGQQARAVRLRLNYLIDIDEAVIVDVEATPARTYDEVEATKSIAPSGASISSQNG